VLLTYVRPPYARQLHMRVELCRSCVNDDFDVLLAEGVPSVPAVGRTCSSWEIGQSLLVCLGIYGRNKRAGFSLHLELAVDGSDAGSCVE